MFTDSHCHLADSTLASRLPEVLADARKNQVHRFIVPAAEAQEWPAVLALAATDIHPALGIHPWFADKAAFNRLPELETYLQQHPELLIGEIGLDYKQCLSENGRELQRRLLSQQLELACRYQRPVILQPAIVCRFACAVEATPDPPRHRTRFFRQFGRSARLHPPRLVDRHRLAAAQPQRQKSLPCRRRIAAYVHRIRNRQPVYAAR